MYIIFKNPENQIFNNSGLLKKENGSVNRPAVYFIMFYD